MNRGGVAVICLGEAPLCISLISALTRLISNKTFECELDVCRPSWLMPRAWESGDEGAGKGGVGTGICDCAGSPLLHICVSLCSLCVSSDLVTAIGPSRDAAADTRAGYGGHVEEQRGKETDNRSLRPEWNGA